MTPNRAAIADLFPSKLPDGCVFRPGLLDLSCQKALLAAVREVETTAPTARVLTKTGGYTSAAITNCGQAGWWSDAKGYRYETMNPLTHQPWPALPDVFRKAVADAVRGTPWSGFTPDACLINFYEPGAKMGLHQDKDERDFSQPIVTVCLGDDAEFMIGGLKRNEKTDVIIVRSGDVLIMGGQSRLRFHGVRKIYPGTGSLPLVIGRYGLTFRKAL